MTRCFCFMLAAGLSLSLAASAQAEWAWPNLNPWSSSTPKTSKSSGFSLWPSWGQSPPKSKQPSVFGKMQQGMNSMTQGTKNLYYKSTQALTPWKNTSNTSRSVTGYGPRTSGSTNKKAKEKSSWLPNLSPWPEEEKKPSEVTDFLKQDRPGF